MLKESLKIVWSYYKSNVLPAMVKKAITYGEEHVLGDLYENIKANPQKTICFKCHLTIEKPQCFYTDISSTNTDNHWVISNSKHACDKPLIEITAKEYSDLIVAHKKCVDEYYEVNK